jgi:hypothetical protein
MVNCPDAGSKIIATEEPSNGSKVYCFDGSTGAKKWEWPDANSTPTTVGEIAGAPAIGDVDGDGRPDIVVLSKDGYVYALRYDTNASTSVCNN